MAMDSSDVKVLGLWISPYVMRARIALKLKSVDYEYIEEESLTAKSDLLLRSNPVHKKVPVLLHSDKSICESLVIVQYIDETWTSGPSILPSDPHDRATSRFWAAYIDDKWWPLMHAIGKAQGDEEKKAALDQVIEGLVLLEEAYTQSSKGKDFFGGDHMGYVDIALGCLVGLIRVTEFFNRTKLLDEAKIPRLVIWAEKFCAHAAVKDLIPETQRIVDYCIEKLPHLKHYVANYDFH